MTNPRTVALWTTPVLALLVLGVLVSTREPLWTSWPGAAVRWGGFVAVAVGLYALAGLAERRRRSGHA